MNDGTGRVSNVVVTDMIPTVNCSPSQRLLFPAFKNQKIIFSSTEVFINPALMEFIPKKIFSNINYPVNFPGLKRILFVKRSNKIIRFEHKLWNALRIVQERPELFNFCGVRWYNMEVFMVDINIFGRLLGSLSPSTLLTSAAGCFASHGFEECSNSIQNLGNLRAYKHKKGKFKFTATEEEIDQVKWTRPNP